MAETIAVAGSYGTYYYIDSSSSRDVLTWDQMCDNAKYFYSVAADIAPNWTVNAISGMLGNIRYEGAMNPSQWQYGLGKSLSGGYGLVQWTPATKFIDWATNQGFPRTSLDAQVKRILYEVENPKVQWITTSRYPLSFGEFVTSQREPSYLASVWLYNYERPKHPLQTEKYRQTMADTWYEYLTGAEPTPPQPPKPPIMESKNKMPFYMYPAWKGVR